MEGVDGDYCQMADESENHKPVFKRKTVHGDDKNIKISYKLPPASLRAVFSFKAQPHSMLDLTIWAVLIGNSKLAHVLWKKTSEPVRTGLILSKVTQQIKKANYPGSGRLSPQEDHELYERWSTQVLDEIVDFKTARLVLTAVLKLYTPPAGYRGGIERTNHIYSWKHANMDLAIDLDFHDVPNMTFLSHPYCTRLVTTYFNGDYVDSRHRLVRTRSSTYMEPWFST